MRTSLFKVVLATCFAVLCTFFAGAQGSNTVAGAMAAPVALPLNAAGSTIGATNDFNDAVSTFDNGPDWCYYVCPNLNGTLYITVTFNPTGGAATPLNASITVITCLQSNGMQLSATQAQSPADINMTMGFPLQVQTGFCYLIHVDGNLAAGYNYNISLTTNPPAMPPATTQSGCTNMGFDNGTTAGWSGDWGHSILTGVAPAPTPSYTPIFNTLNAGHHTVMTPGTDPVAPAIQRVCPLIPGNSNSLMLGDSWHASFGAARIEQKFQVTAANALFTYYYALVIQDGGAAGSAGTTAHTDQQQPFFKIDALDCNGAPIACGNLLVTGGPGIPGFVQSSIAGTYYKNWTPSFIDLTPYIGSCVTIRFTVGDCSQGGHWAYAYLDATCGPMSITAPVDVCQYGSTTLTAPAGASSYSWVNTANPGTVLGTSNTLTVTPTTVGTTTYRCNMVNASGCNAIYNASVNTIAAPEITITNPPAVCSPNTVNITASGVVNITSGTGTLAYFSDPACTVPLPNAGAITTSGTYYVKVTNSNGCFEIRPINVTINTLPGVDVTTPDQSICQGQSVNLNATINPGATTAPVTFDNVTDVAIPDNNTQVSSVINVSGITPQTAGVMPIASVRVNVFHPNDADVDIYLKCPNGTQIQLSTGNGGTGDNYTNTIFVPTGTPITSGTAPFTGSFTPEQAFTGLNGCNVNGAWELVVADHTTGNIGVLRDWSITFNNFVPAPTFTWSPTANMTNPTTLTPTVTPPSTTTYTFTGTSSSGGCTSSDPVVITVGVLIDGTMTGGDTLCQNEPSPTITFTGSNGTPPYTFTYTIDGGSNQTITSDASGTATISASTATPGTHVYVLNNVSNISGCSQVVADTVRIVVNPLPSGTVSGTTQVCIGDEEPVVTFTGSNDTPEYTFTYTINGGASQTVTTSGGNTATVTAPTGQAGTFTYTLTNVEGGNGCSSAVNSTAVITVINNPTAGITGTTTICSGQSATLTVTGTPNATVSYNVNGGGTVTVVLNGAGTGTISTGPLSATTTYTLEHVQAQPPATCGSDLDESVTVTVNPIPVADPINAINVCAGQAVIVPAFTSTPAGATFGWTNSNPGIGLGGSGTGNIAQFNGVNSGTTVNSGTVTYTPTMNGCPGSPSTFTINIHPTPVANAGPDVSACKDAPSLTIGTPGSGSDSYQWTPATGLSSPTVATPAVSTGTPGTTNYQVTVTSGQGCTASDFVSVTIHDIPEVSFVADKREGCIPLRVTFTNTSPNSANCVWNIESIGTVPGCGPIEQTFTSPGTYDVSLTITDVNGCSNTVTENDYITAYPRVVAAFDASPTQQTMLDPVFHFINHSSNATEYDWTFGDGAMSNATHPSHTYEYREGSYNVRLIADNEYGCPDTAYITVSVTPELIYYVPNTFTPDGDEYNNVFQPVFTMGFDKHNYTLLIFNRWGETIFESHDLDFGWDGTYHNEMCQEGVYTWKIIIKEKSVDKFHQFVGHITLLK